MNKILFILILGLSLYNCKKELKNQNEKVEIKAEKSETKKELKFSLYNSTEFELRNITVGLPDTSLTYDKLEKQSQLEWINVKSAYHYGFVRFYDIKNRKYYIQPIDYVGETPFEKGELKFIIKEIDSINQWFELDFEYKNN
ncbi:hypothetical protein [Algibacter mikhailovii]|uniref:hypothetical protein n=1 Tax=Algibacter mikhailovii TaxID=425498 RepID=UPI0024956ACE|nr:hypothetical protein [Algibacter mikhailovii]